MRRRHHLIQSAVQLLPCRRGIRSTLPSAAVTLLRWSSNGGGQKVFYSTCVNKTSATIFGSGHLQYWIQSSNSAHDYSFQPCVSFSTQRKRGQGRKSPPRFSDDSSVDELVQIAHDNLDVMTPLASAALWTKISRQLSRKDGRNNDNYNASKDDRGQNSSKIDDIFQHTIDRLGTYSTRELTQTILSLSKITAALRKQRNRRGEAGHKRVVRELLLNKNMSPKEDIFRLFAIQSRDKLDQFDARHLSNLAYAYAKIGYVPEFDDESNLFDHIATKAVDIRGDFSEQGISNLMWSYATVNKPHLVLFEAMGDQVVAFKHLQGFKPQALKDIVWAFATAGINHPRLFEKVANHIVESDNLDGFRHPQDFSNTVWAYATAQVSNPKLFQKVAEVAIHHKEDFISQEVANLLWAYATMGVTDKKLFSSFDPTATKLVHSYNNQDLANIAWAYAVANIDTQTLFNEHFMKKCAEKEDGFVFEELVQLYQWQLWQTKENYNPGLPDELAGRCHAAFISEDPTISKLQEDVVAQLSSLNLEPKEEVLMRSGYRIDTIVEVNGKSVGVEVDGPSHFIGRSKSPKGSTILKRRQVPAIDGIELVPVPYWKWDRLGKNEQKKQDYLRELLGLV